MKYLLSVALMGMIVSLFSFAEDIDVILIGGQSNATGQGYVRNIPACFKTDSSVRIFYSKFLNQGKGGEQWKALCPASESLDRFGVELSLGTALQRKFPDRRFALIKHGLSGSNLFRQWNPGKKTGEGRGEEYRKFIETVKNGLQKLRDEGHSPTVRAMVWQQGEADARGDAGLSNSKAYAANLGHFIHRVREDVGVKDMPFAYGTVMPMAAPRFTGRDIVKQAQRDVAENAKSKFSIKGAILVEADDLQMRRSDYKTPHPDDDVHLGTYGILTLGERFADALQPILKKPE